jgi:tyrosyl-tRNA synthetase
MLHGSTALANAVRASEVLFGKELAGLSAADVLDIFDDVPSTEIARAALDGGTLLTDLLVICGVGSSKGEAKRLIQSGGVCVNNVRISDAQKRVGADDFIEGQILVLRKGPKQYHLLKVTGG